MITKQKSLALVNSLIAERSGEIFFVSEKRSPHQKLIRDSLQVRVRGAHGIFRDGGRGLGKRGKNSPGETSRTELLLPSVPETFRRMPPYALAS
jgi:hypothetical protein